MRSLAVKLSIVALAALLSWGAQAGSYTYRSSGSVAQNSDSSALAPGACSGLTSGDLMILHTSNRAGTQSIASLATDWTQLAAVTTVPSVEVWARIADGTGADAPSVDWTGTNDSVAWIDCYHGDVYTDLATIIQDSVVTDQGSSATMNVPPLTVSEDNALLVAVSSKLKTATSNDATTITAPSGLTKRQQVIQSGTALAAASYSTQQTTATNYDGTDGTIDGTSENLNGQGVIFTLKSQAAGGPTDCTGYPTGGVQCIELTSVHATSPFFGQGVAAGDFLFTEEETTPSSYPVTAEADATVSYVSGGDTSRQIIESSVYDITAEDTLLFTLVYNNLTCQESAPLFTEDQLVLQIDVAMDDYDLKDECLDPEDDTVTAVANDALPTGLTLTAGVLAGTPTVSGNTTVEFEWEDEYGALYQESQEISIWCLIPDVEGDDEATAIAAIEAECDGWTTVEGTSEYSATVPVGDVVRTDPVNGWLSPPGQEVTYFLSLGELTEFEVIGGRAILPDGTWVTIALADGVPVPETGIIVNGRAIEPDGRGYVADCPDAEDISYYSKGTAVRADGAVCVITGVGGPIINGFLHTDRGELVVTLEAPEFIMNGWGINAMGEASVSDVP